MGENQGGAFSDPIYVSALLMEKGDFETVKAAIDAANGPVEVRRVSFEINATEFLALFKRFSIALSWGGLLAPGREYSFINNE
jgi:hypothetical protein